eukprot:269473_1
MVNIIKHHSSNLDACILNSNQKGRRTSTPKGLKRVVYQRKHGNSDKTKIDQICVLQLRFNSVYPLQYSFGTYCKSCTDVQLHGLHPCILVIPVVELCNYDNYDLYN